MEFDILWWHWIILGILLCISEILGPGFFLLFIGAAALVTGGLSWFAPELPFTITGFIFIFLSLGFCYYAKPFYKKLIVSTHQNLNKRGEQYIGQSFILIEDAQNGKARVKVGDTIWSIRTTKPLKTGDSVVVKSINGTEFIIDEE